MAANICPVCSGEIMTYQRFLKEAEPSATAVCQCCGVHLKRSRGAYLLLACVGIAGAVLTGLTIVLATREVIPAWLAIVTLLAVCAGFAMVAHLMGWRLVGWVVLDDPLATGPGMGRIVWPTTPKKPTFNMDLHIR